MPAGEVSHRPPGRLEGPCSPRHEALLAGAWKDLASLHRAALIRDHRRPRTASAWRPRALARRAALRWFGSFDSLCRRTPGGRGSQKWLRGPLTFGRGTASGTSSVATAARRAAARRCWRWWFEVGIVQSSVDESRASAGRVPCLCGKWQHLPAGGREGGPRGLKVRSRYPAVPDAWHAGQWSSRPVRGWSEGGRAQEGDGAGKGAVMRCGEV